ncbi:MAG: hypothetical protein AABM29_09435 [Actinomycetota bacterium]
MRSLGRLAVALLFAATLAGSSALTGCGESDGPKRAVDAHTEALRFYGVDTPVVALLGNRPAADLASLERAATGLPAWYRLSNSILDPLRAAGIDYGELQRLMRPQDQIEGVRAAALAVGIPTAGPLDPSRSLVVLASDQTELLDHLLRLSEDEGRLRATGRLDEARLYANEDAAYAARDGVLVSTPSLAGVRAALQRRDGDSDLQLDEGVVNDLLGDLRTEGPLEIYANLDRVIEADPAARELAALTPWVEALGQAGASASPVDGKLRVEVLATTREELQPGDLPAGDVPTSFTLAADDVDSILQARAGSPDTLRHLLLGVAPVSGEATAGQDEIHAEALLSP